MKNKSKTFQTNHFRFMFRSGQTSQEQIEVSIEKWKNKLESYKNTPNKVKFKTFQIKELENILEQQNQLLRSHNLKSTLNTHKFMTKLIENITTQKNLLKNEEILKSILDSIFLIINPWKDVNDEEFTKKSLEWGFLRLVELINSTPLSHYPISFRIIPLKKEVIFLQVVELLILKNQEKEHLNKDFIKIITEEKYFSLLSSNVKMKLLSSNVNILTQFIDKLIVNKLQNPFSNISNDGMLFLELFQFSNFTWSFVFVYLKDLYFKTRNQRILTLLIDLFNSLTSLENCRNHLGEVGFHN
jgi:hypothetical protein